MSRLDHSSTCFVFPASSVASRNQGAFVDVMLSEATKHELTASEAILLPDVRSRVLTLSFSNDTISQDCSNGFFKLPRELRDLIYQEALGDQVLHIVNKSKRLGYSRCRAASRDACPTPESLGSVETNGLWKGRGKAGNALCLLLTGRKA